MVRSAALSIARCCAFVVVAVACSVAVAAPAGPLRVAVDESAIRILAGDRLVLAYAIDSPPVPPGVDAACSRTGILHPVCSPRGTVVTTAYPRDHPHQSGIFTAWVNATLDGARVDFWNLPKRQARVLHAGVRDTFSTDAGAGFEVDLLHRAETADPVDVLRETWKVTVRPTDGSHHCFDLDTVQRAIPPHSLQLAKYHYGGLAVRGPEAWLLPTDADLGLVPDVKPTGATLVNDRGEDRLAGNLAHACWVALASRPPAAPACLVAMVHPESFRAPQATRLHPTKPYFCFAPCADGEFVIDEATPYAARYRFLVTDGAVDRGWIDARWREWTAIDSGNTPASTRGR